MNFKELLENKLFKMLAIVIGVIVVLVIVIVLIMSLTGGRVSTYSALEDRMIAAAKNYYQNNTNLLPGEVGGKTEVDSTTLVEGDYLKSLEKLAPKGSTCSGRVVVKNVNQGYFYQAFVNCGDAYQTTTLASHIKSHESTTSVGTGLYAVNGDLIYRGENPNNYVQFAGRLYRIVRVRNNDTIDIIATETTTRAVWDNRYNEDRKYDDGINDYAVSRIRDTLLTYVNSDAFTDNERSQLEPHSLCVGKVGINDVLPLDAECSSTIEGQIIGLLPVSSYIYASLDASCKTVEDGTCENYNYLQTEYNWWTLTADASSSYRAVYVAYGSAAYSTRCSSSSFPREVLRLTENVAFVSGTGTQTDPYIVK